jgi:V/A-type H+-transporting ATPase subunit I
MNRFSLLTFERNKQILLKTLQAFEQVHFKRLSPDDFEGMDVIRRNVENAAALENELSRVNYATDRLKPYAEIPKGIKAMLTPPQEMSFEELDRFASEYDAAAACESVRGCDERIKSIHAELSRVKTENDNLRLWAGFDAAPSELDKLKHVRYITGAVNKKTAPDFLVNLEAAFPSAYVETLHTVKDDTVFFVVAPADGWDALTAELKNMGFTRITLSFTGIPADKVRENEKRIATLALEAEAALEELKSHAPQYAMLLTAADHYRTALERAKACENFVNLSDVLIIEGWVPQEESPNLKKLLDTACPNEYYIEETAVEADSAEVPIALKNNRFARAFEDVTAMFAMPRYNEIDPTPLLAPFYILFFGLMVGDFGYGLVLLIATALLLKFAHLKKSMRRFMQFFFFLSFGVIFAGFLYGSFFGFALDIFKVATAPDGTAKAILSSDYDILVMLVMSVVIGVVQVFFGFGVKAYMAFRDGKPLEAFLDSILWIITLTCGLGMFSGAAPDVVPAIVFTISQYGFFGGLILLFLTQGRSSPSIGGKIGNGLMGVYGITGYIGDFISYSRLTAIALSGAYIASSFDMMAVMIPMPARIIFGTLIFLVGNLLNMGLGFLGAYVHGARLQFVEFFGKFYEGGGIPFKPFSPKNVFITLKETKTNHN